LGEEVVDHLQPLSLDILLRGDSHGLLKTPEYVSLRQINQGRQLTEANFSMEMGPDMVE
jgi:hypothetical protein